MTNRTFVGVTDTAWGATPSGASLNWSAAFTPSRTEGAILNGSSPSDVVLPANPECLSLDCTGFTHTLDGTAASFLDIYGPITLDAGMTVTSLGLRPKADCSITSSGKTFSSIQANNAGIDFTFIDDCRVVSGLECDDGIINFGTNICYVASPSGNTSIYVADTSYGAGAALDIQTYSGHTAYLYPTISGNNFPPTTIHGTATASLEEYDWDMSGGPHMFQSLTVTSGGMLLNGAVDIETVTTLTLTAGPITGLGGNTVTVGSNFNSSVDLVGASEWFLNVTGTVTVAPGRTITHCTSTNAFDASGCIDGGNNSGNITFAVVNTAPVADAGDDQSVNTLNDIALDGSGTTDDGLPDPPGALTYLWSKVSGPGTVTFDDATSAITTCSVSDSGTYVLRLTADDDDLNDSDDVTILVDAVAPYIANITGVADTYVSTDHIDLTLTMSENVTKSGSVRLAIQLNNGVKYASYISGDATDTWVFRYTVGALDGASPLTAIGIDLNGGSMVDDLGNDMLLDAPIEGGAGSLSDNAEIIIDNTNDVVAPRPNHRRLGMLR